ncbi:c-type cytochrome biogenesis protein CcmI [Acuticoccus sp.]|uniref:c-type cytochrome biogenesis protein CcmI n=1 Tax=Acuticoccus sp. TaxID=1904378 RepID=UPI003B52EA40
MRPPARTPKNYGMELWFPFAGLAAVTLGIVLYPLLARRSAAVGGSDASVYAAQLEEIDADVARGVLADADAEAARSEVARRLLRAHRGAGAAPTVGGRRFLTAGGVALAVSLTSAAGYVVLGMPGYGDQPLAARGAPLDPGDRDALVASLEAQLEQRPSDGGLWASVAPLYLQARRFVEAAAAFDRAGTLLGEDAGLLTGQAQSVTFAAGGVVTDEALELLRRAEALDPDAERAQIFLAIAERQRGLLQEARGRWMRLLEDVRDGAPWRPIAEAELARIDAAGPRSPTVADVLTVEPPPASVGPTLGTTGDATPRGPSQGLVAAAAELDPSARNAMIEGMVARLAARLEAEGGTADEWARLVRSYEALGRGDAARSARETAMASLADAQRARFAAAVGDDRPVTE